MFPTPLSLTPLHRRQNTRLLLGFAQTRAAVLVQRLVPVVEVQQLLLFLAMYCDDDDDDDDDVVLVK